MDRRLKEILKRLRMLREAKKFTQDIIARQLRCDRTTYVRKENGLVPITTVEWIKISEFLNVPVAYFFYDGKEANRNKIENF